MPAAGAGSIPGVGECALRTLDLREFDLHDEKTIGSPPGTRSQATACTVYTNIGSPAVGSHVIVVYFNCSRTVYTCIDFNEYCKKIFLFFFYIAFKMVHVEHPRYTVFCATSSTENANGGIGRKMHSLRLGDSIVLSSDETIPRKNVF